MPRTPITPKPQPTGTRTIRLADIPPAVRERAARKLMRQAVDDREYFRYVELAFDPGDAGGRIAA